LHPGSKQGIDILARLDGADEKKIWQPQAVSVCGVDLLFFCDREISEARAGIDNANFLRLHSKNANRIAAGIFGNRDYTVRMPQNPFGKREIARNLFRSVKLRHNPRGQIVKRR